MLENEAKKAEKIEFLNKIMRFNCRNSRCDVLIFLLLPSFSKKDTFTNNRNNLAKFIRIQPSFEIFECAFCSN